MTMMDGLEKWNREKVVYIDFPIVMEAVYTNQSYNHDKELMTFIIYTG